MRELYVKYINNANNFLEYGDVNSAACVIDIIMKRVEESGYFPQDLELSLVVLVDTVQSLLAAA